MRCNATIAKKGGESPLMALKGKTDGFASLLRVRVSKNNRAI
jgi:hypothetical protein